MTNDSRAYLISKTDAGHGGGPVEVLGIYLCSYEQAQAVVEDDRAEEHSSRVERWERDKNHFSGSEEDYFSMYEESYTVESHKLEDLGGRD